MMNRLLMTSGLLVLSFCASLTGQQPTGPKPLETSETLPGFLTEGGITNVVDGHAMYLRFEHAPQLLKAQQKLANNDEVWVGDKSRAEILLNPGSYLRLSPNSRVRFLDLSPDNLKLKLLQGSAIIEVLVEPFEGNNPSPRDVRDKFTAYQPITVLTPDAEFVTARSGIYRGDVNSEGRSSLKVVKGVAVVAGDLIKEGKSTMLGERIPTVNNFDKKQEDDFDSWSHKRALELVALNKSLRNTDWHTKLRKNPRSFFSIIYDEYSKRMKERLVVSAIGGLVSYAEPGAAIQRNQSEWQPLVSEAALEYGDRVRTSDDARVEVRVYPQCYLLIAGNTEIIYGSKEGLAAIRVIKGSAIIASNIPRKEGRAVSFLAGDSLAQVLKPGFYRLNLNPSRESDFLVYDGEAELDGTELKTGQRAILFGPRLIIAHTRRMDLDAFELWSRKRSSFLFQPTDLSRQQRIRPSIATRRVELTGLWYFDETAGAHTFVPGFRDFSSPYGGRYSVGFAGKFHR